MSRRAPPAAARVYLEAPLLRHGREFVAAARRSKKLHSGWVSAPATLLAFARFVERARRPTRRVFLVRLKGTHELAGVVTLGDIVLGVDGIAAQGVDHRPGMGPVNPEAFCANVSPASALIGFEPRYACATLSQRSLWGRSDDSKF